MEMFRKMFGRIPPHGMAGHNQQTDASKLTASVGLTGTNRRVRRARKARKTATPRAPKRVKATRSKRGPMRKGSAAAKAWGRKMRRLRRK